MMMGGGWGCKLQPIYYLWNQMLQTLNWPVKRRARGLIKTGVVQSEVITVNTRKPRPSAYVRLFPKIYRE